MGIPPDGDDADQRYPVRQLARRALRNRPALLWQSSEDTSLLLRAYLQKDPAGGYHGSTPFSGRLTQHNGQWLKDGFNEGESSVQQYKRREQIYSYEFSHRFNDIWSVRSNASYTHSSVALDQVYPTGWIDNSNKLARCYSVLPWLA